MGGRGEVGEGGLGGVIGGGGRGGGRGCGWSCRNTFRLFYPQVVVEPFPLQFVDEREELRFPLGDEKTRKRGWVRGGGGSDE